MYTRIQSVEALHRALRNPETYELDFKKFVDPKEWWELAKDIAAFANYIGGVILVGAAENSSGTADLSGIPAVTAQDTKDAYEKAARDKCLPRPLVTVWILEPAEISGRCVLAVNVEPVPDQIVGSMFYATNKAGKPETSDAWRFPVRIGKDNVLITPDRIPMFIDAKIRRAAIRLSSIRQGSASMLVWRHPTNQFDDAPARDTIVGLEVDLAANVFRARRVIDRGEHPFSVPLDDVEAVWEETQGSWRIRVTGWLDERSSYVTNPSNTVIHR
jgi:hypothetical protein